jgi:hypothetical protein
MALFLISIVTDRQITELNSFKFAINLRFVILWISQQHIILNWGGKQYKISYLPEKSSSWKVKTTKHAGVPEIPRKKDNHIISRMRLAVFGMGLKSNGRKKKYRASSVNSTVLLN